MKKLVILIGIAILLAVKTQAQVTNIVVSKFDSATNWALIPYGAYDTGTKKLGGGAALLYSVNQYTWIGVRAQSLNGQSTTAGVQGQLQISETFNGIKFTPFVEASTGMGNTSLYANAGTGALVSFHQWTINKNVTLEIGVVGDYEHYVYGPKNGNQVNAGPLIYLSF